jgi:hypothetical protein
VRELAAGRDAAGVGDVQEEPQVDEVKAWVAGMALESVSSLRKWRRLPSAYYRLSAGAPLRRIGA